MQAEVASGRMSSAQAADEIDVRALGRPLWRKRGLIIALTLMAAVIAFVAVNLMTSRYRSEARVLIETRDNIFTRPDAEKTVDRGATIDQEAVTSQVQLILSRDLARDIIRRLKLSERPEFDPVLRGTSFVRTLMGLAGVIKDPMSQTPEERVLKSYFDRLAAFQVEKSRVIAIEFDSEDPELTAQAANAIAEGYLVLQQSAKQDQTRAAGLWLSGEIENLRSKVAEAESRVEQYRSTSNLFVGTNNTTLSNQQLGDLNAQVASARAQKADAEAKARIIRDILRTGTPGEFPDITNSELLRRLAEQRVTLRAQLGCGPSLPSSPPRCSISIHASRNCARRLPISSASCAPRPIGSHALSKTTPRSPARASRRSAPASTSSSARPPRPTSSAHHLDRDRVDHPGLAEKAADGAAVGARHVCPLGRLRRHRRAAGQPASPRNGRRRGTRGRGISAGSERIRGSATGTVDTGNGAGARACSGKYG